MRGPEQLAGFDTARFRDDYWKSLEYEKPFYVERPPAFTPAAAAQEHYSQSAIMLKFISQWLPWQYTDYHDESMSFHESAYLGDWSSLPKFRVSGPDAATFLGAYCANSFRKFDPGQIKHSIQTNEDGKLVGEGILYRLGDGSFRYTGGGVYWLDYWLGAGDWDAVGELDTPDEFVFAIQGPRSIDVLEALAGERLRDLGFGRARPVRIADDDLMLLRTGVTGELGYELHGPSQLANEIWTAVFETGKPYGLRLLGGRSQLVSHVEHGFATIGRDYWPAASTTEKAASRAHRIARGGGSYPWNDVTELARSPLELGWEGSIAVHDHEFVGSDVLAKQQADGTARRWVGLEWSSEDVIDLYAALFRDGPLTTPMDMPRTIDRHAMNPDSVLVDNELVGCSTSRAYSTFLRRMISLCVLNREHAHDGQRVTVVWGNRGDTQREIRATVRGLPFKPDNRRVDLTDQSISMSSGGTYDRATD